MAVGPHSSRAQSSRSLRSWIVRMVAAAFVLGLLRGGTLAEAQAAKPTQEVASAVVIPDEYVVVFGKGMPRFHFDSGRPSAKAVRAAVRQSRRAEAAALAEGGKILYRFRAALIGFVAHLPTSAYDRVKAMPGVWMIDESRSYPLPRIRLNLLGEERPQLSWGLDRIDQRVGTDRKFNIVQASSDVHVYVIDSGILRIRSQFGNRIGKGKSVFPDDPKTRDCRGHGTHVAGTIGSASYGVANEVTLHPVRVVDCNGKLTTQTIARGVDWVFHHYVRNGRAFPAVANLSLVAEETPSLERMVRNSVDLGITYVLAAGNDTSDACSFSPGGELAAITVANIDPRTDKMYGSSNFGPCVDIFAPGVDILSLGIGADKEEARTGTSMAAPHVTGVAALYLQAHPELRPRQRPAAVWNAIRKAATVPGCHGWGGVGDMTAPTANRLLYWGRDKDKAPCARD